jgi:predicted RNase H-like HicB family nuclease
LRAIERQLAPCRKRMVEAMKPKARYTLRLERDEDGWWVASVPGVPGCHTQGRTIEQATERAREALGLFIGDAAETVELLAKTILPSSAARVLKRAIAARSRMEAEIAKAAVVTKEAVEVLTKLKLSRRDAGELLGVTRQRIQQILHDGKRLTTPKVRRSESRVASKATRLSRAAARRATRKSANPRAGARPPGR